MAKILLNCDLGENESAEQTRALLELVDMANVGCGVHAGSREKTYETICMAVERGVLVGAHPGLAAAGGRGAALPSAVEFRALVGQQVADVAEMLRGVGGRMYHVKLHGSLYHAVDRDAELAAAYLEIMQAYPEARVVCAAGGEFAAKASAAKLRVCEEIFADRGYADDGLLQPRNQVGAVIDDVEAAVERVLNWQTTGTIDSVTGQLLKMSGETVCVHSDSPNALELIVALRNNLM